MTIKEIEIKAEDFNELYFENKIDLSEINFKISNRMTSTRGRFRVKQSNQYLTIAKYLTIDEYEVSRTLVHELIHALEWQTRNTMSHGRFFKQWSNRIYTLSKGKYNITRLTQGSKSVNEYRKSITVDKNSYYALLDQNRQQLGFIKNLTSTEIIHTLVHGVRVFRINKMEGVQHYRNYTSYLTRKYFYPTHLFKEVEVTKEYELSSEGALI